MDQQNSFLIEAKTKKLLQIYVCNSYNPSILKKLDYALLT